MQQFITLIWRAMLDLIKHLQFLSSDFESLDKGREKDELQIGHTLFLDLIFFAYKNIFLKFLPHHFVGGILKIYKKQLEIFIINAYTLTVFPESVSPFTFVA